MKTATVSDFMAGATLIDKEDGRISFTLTGKDGDGIWLGKNSHGEKCIFECEADGYYVK